VQEVVEQINYNNYFENEADRLNNDLRAKEVSQLLYTGIFTLIEKVQNKVRCPSFDMRHAALAEHQSSYQQGSRRA
jgi:hypothetical protein